MARESDARARLDDTNQILFDLLPSPAYVIDSDELRFLEVNRAAVERYGYTREQFLQLKVFDLRPGEDRAAVERMLARHVGAGQHREILQHVAQDGESFQVEILSQSILYKGRRSHYVIVTELGERQRVHDALLESRVRLQALFDNALDGMAFINDAAQFVGVNPAACTLLRCEPAALLHQPIWVLAPDGGMEQLRALWQKFLENGRLSGEYTIRALDGSLHDVEFASVANVQPSLHLTIVRDVTARNIARQEAEEGLREMNRRLRHLSARSRARREEDRTRLSRELHDQLGQALAGLKIDLCWCADRVRSGGSSSTELLAKVHVMTALVDETILAMRRIASELRPPVLDRLGLVAALEWQIDEFQKRTGIASTLRTRLDQLALDRGRSTAVFRIFQEALANVAVHSGATRVAVTLAAPRGNLVLRVVDNGQGIDREVVDHGQSLGLIGMRERAQLLGGEVIVGPARDRGTMVVVTVPMEERRRQPRDLW